MSIKLSIRQGRILNYFAHRVPNHGTAQITNDDIIDHCNVSHRTVYKAIQKFKKWHLIKTSGVFNHKISLTSNGRLLMSNHYHNKLPWLSIHQYNTLLSIYHHAQRSAQGRLFTRINNKKIAADTHYKYTTISPMLRALTNSKHVIKIEGPIQNRVIHLTELGIKVINNRQNSVKPKYQQVLPPVQARLLSIILGTMKNGKTQIKDQDLAKKLKMNVNDISEALMALRLQRHLLKNIYNRHIHRRTLILTAKGQNLIKQKSNKSTKTRPIKTKVVKSVKSSQSTKLTKSKSSTSQITKLKVNRKHPIIHHQTKSQRSFDLSKCIPVNVNAPIFPYELVFHRGNSSDNDLMDDNDQITLGGTPFNNFLSGYDDVQFFKIRDKPSLLIMKPCLGNETDPSVVNIIRHHNQLVIWSVNLVKLLSHMIPKGNVKQVYLTGNRIDNAIVFNTHKARPFYV